MEEEPPPPSLPPGAATSAASEVADIRVSGPQPLRLLEWKVSPGSAVKIGSVLAVCAPIHLPARPGTTAAEGGPTRKVKAERPGVVRELCAQLGRVIPPGGVLLRLEACSHPVVMKGLCAECGQDLTQLRSKNGKQNMPVSTATVSMVHSVPELMVSSEQAEQLGREDQERLRRNRKLVLMVDLDQTLIHTTEHHCQQMSNRGIFHYQLGRGEPMLHTRLRPHCKEFLEKIAKLYELHVFTFGSRLYAHTIAAFLDSEKKLFSHRILSRDECIDPCSKTGNLRNLFPCGDSMVCIIDDREDVWKFAPNLITVKKYVYFQGTGDINAPPGSKEAQMRKKANHSSKLSETSDPVAVTKDSEEVKNVGNTEEQSNGIRKTTKEINGNNSIRSETSSWDLNSNDKVKDSVNVTDHLTDVTSASDLMIAKDSLVSSDQDKRIVTGKQQTSNKATNYLDFELSSDSESDSGLDARKSSSSSATDSENEGKRSWRKSKRPVQEESIVLLGTDTNVEKDGQENHSGDTISSPSSNPHTKPFDLEVHEESEQDSLCSLGNGCSDKKEAETESQNSEQSGITVGESLDQSMEEDDDDDTDQDDHLIYLEEILVRVHTDYYSKYDKYVRKETDEIPDIRKIVPELKQKVLSGVTILFSGLYPTNYPIENTREHYHATALGAKIAKNLVLNEDDPNRTTHLIAARAGTEKVRQGQSCKNLHIVNPDWLWSCLERWDKVEEQLFPLKDDYLKTQRENSPAMFPDIHSAFQTALFHPTPIHPKCQPGPEVRLYDPNTGKLIRKGSQNSSQSMNIQGPSPSLGLPVHGEHSLFRVVQPHQQFFDEEGMPPSETEEPGPSKRKRQVDDILGEGSDDSDSEKKKGGERKEKAPQDNTKDTTNIKIDERPVSASLSERSLTGNLSRGHKRKLDEDDVASESSKGSSNEDEEGSSSEADEMAAALEAELNDFM
ncbi:RNA polymerase II subunit A C-terminal domain phosphatase isoform X2 [Sceloporus undulatus]|uniref:RNA polymerase II subunit A C-terminal domain phosphatase isoform X2 n=1 Tax=Sceloporus undulatus TaxID=8520 RepID=UPI001C4B8FBA|nr:RNA polymerase II subunit A C-terminal domain phosphatase isoform X2 [Sceloporus undulatus]